MVYDFAATRNVTEDEEYGGEPLKAIAPWG